MPEPLPKSFASREELCAFVASISPGIEVTGPGAIRGGAKVAEERLAAIEPLAYARTRNFLNGKVTGLSPYIRHGVLSLNRVRNEALARALKPDRIWKFVVELAWRDYWQRIYRAHPEWIWEDAEPYKTGFSPSDYADELPEDIARGKTGVALIDQVIHELIATGYMHNHARMYVASYVVHWRRVKWQAGARWFLHHLLDGDPASNNLSWQWVASTFSNKPYIFNLENVQRYAGPQYETSPENNAPLNADYGELTQRLFLRKSGADD